MALKKTAERHSTVRQAAATSASPPARALARELAELEKVLTEEQLRQLHDLRGKPQEGQEGATGASEDTGSSD